MPELWDVYDEEKNKTGRYHERGQKLKLGDYHLVVHVWIKNSQGEYLISKRSKERESFPLMWECVGGSVICDENSKEGALREVKEEVGIDLDPAKGKLIFSQIRHHYQDILDVWLFEYNGKVDLKYATTNEVAEVKWMEKTEIKELYDSGKLINTLTYFFEGVI